MRNLKKYLVNRSITGFSRPGRNLQNLIVCWNNLSTEKECLGYLQCRVKRNWAVLDSCSDLGRVHWRQQGKVLNGIIFLVVLKVYLSVWPAGEASSWVGFPRGASAGLPGPPARPVRPARGCTALLTCPCLCFCLRFVFEHCTVHICQFTATQWFQAPPVQAQKQRWWEGTGQFPLEHLQVRQPWIPVGQTFRQSDDCSRCSMFSW